MEVVYCRCDLCGETVNKEHAKSWSHAEGSDVCPKCAMEIIVAVRNVVWDIGQTDADKRGVVKNVIQVLTARCPSADFTGPLGPRLKTLSELTRDQAEEELTMRAPDVAEMLWNHGDQQNAFVFAEMLAALYYLREGLRVGVNRRYRLVTIGGTTTPMDNLQRIGQGIMRGVDPTGEELK